MTQNDWLEAYESDTFKELKKRRYRFIVPCAVGIGVVVSFLFFMQNWIPSLGLATPFGGYMNVDLIYSLLLMPLSLLVGYLYIRYAGKNLTPLEDEINKKYESKVNETDGGGA